MTAAHGGHSPLIRAARSLLLKPPSPESGPGVIPCSMNSQTAFQFIHSWMDECVLWVVQLYSFTLLIVLCTGSERVCDLAHVLVTLHSIQWCSHASGCKIWKLHIEMTTVEWEMDSHYTVKCFIYWKVAVQSWLWTHSYFAFQYSEYTLKTV